MGEWTLIFLRASTFSKKPAHSRLLLLMLLGLGRFAFIGASTATILIAAAVTVWLLLHLSHLDHLLHLLLHSRVRHEQLEILLVSLMAKSAVFAIGTTPATEIVLAWALFGVLLTKRGCTTAATTSVLLLWCRSGRFKGSCDPRSTTGIWLRGSYSNSRIGACGCRG